LLSLGLFALALAVDTLSLQTVLTVEILAIVRGLAGSIRRRFTPDACALVVFACYDSSSSSGTHGGRTL
jgi:hypothetical protein